MIPRAEHAHLHTEGHLWPGDGHAKRTLGGLRLAASSQSETAVFLLAIEDGSNGFFEAASSITPLFPSKCVHRPDRSMLHSFALFIILCSSAIAAPLSLLRGSEPDGLTKVEPDHDGWFAHGGGDGLLGNLGDVLSGSLLDGMSGEDTLSRRPVLVRQEEAEPALFAQATLSTLTATTL